MSRNLRLAHLPPTQPRLRWSGYLTTPGITDAQVQSALSPFLLNLTIWRTRAALPRDWPAADDSMIQSPPAGVTPLWGEGASVSTATVIGDPETPWRLVVGSGQLVVENVWLLDASADPWQPPCTPVPGAGTVCPPCVCETVVPPTESCHPTRAGVVGVLLGAATVGGLLLTYGRRV